MGQTEPADPTLGILLYLMEEQWGMRQGKWIRLDWTGLDCVRGRPNGTYLQYIHQWQWAECGLQVQALGN